MLTQVIKGIHLPQSDTHFAGQIDKNPLFMGKGTYQFNKIETALMYVKSRRVALDIGAHVGLWSRVLAHSFRSVVAFEPVLEHVKCFERNLSGTPNITLHQTALGYRTKFALIETTPGNSGNAHVAPTGTFVEMRALDSYAVLKDVDFIKIDVEGYEMAVVEGGGQLIKRDRPVMVVEQKPGNAEQHGFRTGSVIELLKSWGYRQVWVKSGDYCMVWR